MKIVVPQFLRQVALRIILIGAVVVVSVESAPEKVVINAAGQFVSIVLIGGMVMVANIRIDQLPCALLVTDDEPRWSACK